MGVTRTEGEVYLHKLDHHIRIDLDATSARRLAVLRPLRITITNLAEGHREEVEAQVRADGVEFMLGMAAGEEMLNSMYG